MKIDVENLDDSELYSLRNEIDTEIRKREKTKEENELEDRKAYLLSNNEDFYGNDQCASYNCRLTCMGCDDRM